MRLVTVITFTITNGKIVAIDVIADTQRLGQLIIESPPRQVCATGDPIPTSVVRR